MKLLLALLLALQFAQRPSLSPAETLLESVILRAINDQPSGGPPVQLIDGTDKNAGGVERRPVTPREVQHRERVRDRLTRSPQRASMRIAPCELHSHWGNGAPAFAFPPLSLRFRRF